MNRQRVHQGFTLVELLVVMAIISLLASLLLPALNRATGEARKIACVSLLKQIGIANQFYADAFDDYCVPPGNWSSSRCWYRNQAFLDELGFTAVYSGGNWSHSYWPKRFLCPGSNAASQAHSTEAGYALAPASWGINTQSMHPRYYVRRREVERLPGGLSSRVFIMDHVSLEATSGTADPSRYDTYGDYGGHPNDSADGRKRVAYRHNGMASVLFFDAHSAAVGFDRLYAPASDADFHNRTWRQR